MSVDPNPAKIAGAVQWVEARVHQFRGVPDVVEPSRCHEIFRQRQLLGGPPSPPSNRPHMQPAARQLSREHLLSKPGGIIAVPHIPDGTGRSRTYGQVGGAGGGDGAVVSTCIPPDRRRQA